MLNGEARRRTRDKPWGEHMGTKHAQKRLALGNTVFADVSVLAREGDRASRKLREAVEIRKLGPQINTNSGWGLL